VHYDLFVFGWIVIHTTNVIDSVLTGVVVQIGRYLVRTPAVDDRMSVPNGPGSLLPLRWIKHAEFVAVHAAEADSLIGRSGADCPFDYEQVAIAGCEVYDAALAKLICTALVHAAVVVVAFCCAGGPGPGNGARPGDLFARQGCGLHAPIQLPILTGVNLSVCSYAISEFVPNNNQCFQGDRTGEPPRAQRHRPRSILRRFPLGRPTRVIIRIPALVGVADNFVCTRLPGCSGQHIDSIRALGALVVRRKLVVGG
jgi:hypothetical protein